MASIINATVTSGLTANSDVSGNLIFQTSSNNVLTLDSSQNATFAGSVSAPNTFGFKNRIINGKFQIAQRGTSGTAGNGLPTTTATYPSVDRWFAYYTGAAVTVAQVSGSGNNKNLIQATGAASVTAIGIGQRIEAVNCYDLAGQTVTLSASIANSLLTTVTWTAYYAGSTDVWTSSTQIATGTFTVSSTLTTYSTQISIPSAATTGLQIIFSVGSQTSGTFQIGNAQLELGSIATPFDQRNYGTELGLCQRYYAKYTSLATYSGFGNGVFSSSTGGAFEFKLPITMRSGPTISISNLAAYDGSSILAITGLGATYIGLDYINQDFTVASGGIATRPANIVSNNTIGAFLSFSAEL
jgi:hypothetical protein